MSRKHAQSHNKPAIKRVPASVQLLENRLTSYDPEIREQAWRGIDKLGAPEDSLIENIVELFEHQNLYVREAGRNALAHCVDAGFGENAAKSVEAFLEHADPHIRYSASRCLLKLQERVEVRVDGLKKKKVDPEKVEKAALPAEHGAEMVSKRLSHENPKIRKEALDGLSRMGSLCIPYAVTICNMVIDPDLSVRNEVHRVLERQGKNMEDGITTLANFLGHDELRFRMNAKRALLEMSKVCGHEVAEAVCAPLKSENRITRLAALDCFQSLGALSAAHGAELAEHLEETDAEVRLTTVRTLISAGKSMSSHQSDIRKRLQHKDPDTVRAAVQTLRGLAFLCSKFARGAHKDLQEGAESIERLHAIEILGGSGHNSKPYLEEIVKTLEDKNWSLRRAAIEALCDLEEHADAAANEVARRLLHHDPDVRRSAAEALGRMGLHAGEYGHRVEGLLDTEEDEDVKATCAAACEMLYAAGMEHG